MREQQGPGSQCPQPLLLRVPLYLMREWWESGRGAQVLWHGGSYGVPVFMVLAVQAHQGLESQQEAR